MIDLPGSPQYLSPNGGFWTDTADALVQLAAMEQSGDIAHEDVSYVRQFITDGFAIIQGAVTDQELEALALSVDGIFSGVSPRLMTYWGTDGEHHFEPASRDHMMETEAKLLDIHAVSPAVQDVIFAPKIRRFLETIFRDPAMAFQSLYFERGSEQSIHQDTAFVPIADAPLDFIASWIALEDVEPGTGELLYVPGSHRLPDLIFDEGKRCTPADSRIHLYEELVQENYTRAGLAPIGFLPKKGDVLFWAADLCHGGSPIEKKGETRRSVITHYCPISRRPLYATQGDFDITYSLSGGYIVSQT